MSDSEGELREDVVRGVRLLFQAGVMSHSGHGNVSVRLPEGERMLLTSKGTISELGPDDLTVVDFDGQAVDGTLQPVAAEIVSMHAAVYRQRQDARAVIHTHSPHVTSFALAHAPLPCAYEALLRHEVVEDIPVADWGPRGSDASVRAIADTLRRHPGVRAILLANHGLLAFGPTVQATAQLIVAMEEAAEATIGAGPLGGVQPFPAGALDQVRAHVARFS